ncbi:MAG TPA: DEAD/DEAH box helicase, partial [Vicinamibacterales bacterium]|nr:DEAD/DEAH box helicase [Vicinamibacterales bacterium]
ELLKALNTLGYEEPTPIQQATIPALIEGRDVLGQAATGTGKTAAFALPILQSLALRRKSAEPVALVLVPTRELAMQVAEAMHRYGKDLNVRVLPIYGGQPIGRQIRELERGIDIVVATPGRAIDHITRGTLRLDQLRIVVLDEADEMLDMGFAEDIEQILSQAPTERQTILFSATLPPRIAKLTRQYLRNPLNVQIEREATEAGELPLVRQTAYVVQRAYKLAALGRVLDLEAPEAALVFCRTRTEVDQLTEALNGRGYRSEALHGGMSQEQRDRVMKKLRSGNAELLIATDVAARGLDVDVLTHVINYDVPSAPESYVHRIGRVGRAGREGVAITLAEPREHRLLKNIERVSKQKIEIGKVPTVADLRARRMDLTRASLREALMAGELDRYQVVIDALSEEFDIVDIAAAAIKLAHEAATPGEDDEDDIPAVRLHEGDRDRSRERGRERAPARGGAARPRERGGNTTRIFVGLGRAAGVRPQDLVGAITGEAGLKGRDIGQIEIADRFSLVEVGNDVADGVIAALRGTTIKGKRMTVRRERFEK